MAADKINLAVLISGRGSNLQALIEACEQDHFPARITVVISNKSDAGGLKRAEKHDIPTLVIPHKEFASRDAFEDALIKAIVPYDIDVICLAGFMRVLTPHFIDHYAGRIINIHPSLLPDYKGLNTHERVLKDGASQTGCTVHYVVPDVDSGDVIVQKIVDVLPDDTVETLAARVLEQEHVAYPEAVAIVASTILQNRDNKLESL